MTVIDHEPQPGKPHHDLAAAVHGHAAILEAIAEHAAEHAAARELARQEAHSAELDGSPAGSSTY